jgi:hypothetical protein
VQVVLISGRRNRGTDALLDAVRRWLDGPSAIRLTVLDDEAEGSAAVPSLPDEVDVVVLVGDTSTLDEEELDAVGRLARDGCGLVALGAVPDRRRGGRRMQWSALGAQLVGSAEPRPVAIEGEPSARRHPIHRRLDLSDWQSELSTAVLPLSADALVLLSAVDGDDRQPAAWARQHGRGRVFGTLLGSEHDLAQPAFEQLVTSAVAWAAGRR